MNQHERTDPSPRPSPLRKGRGGILGSAFVMEGSWREGFAGSQFAWGGSWGKGGLLGTGYGIFWSVDDQFNGLGAMFVIPVVKQADPQAGERNLLSNRRVGGGSQSHGGFGLAGRN